MKLLESKHPYYCNEGNYFDNNCFSRYDRWQDFMEDEGDSDKDLNLLFRFDWENPTDEDGESVAWQGDENYRDCKLKLFWMGQRKGIYRYTIIDVCRADESAIKAWLQERFDYLLRLWTPFVAKES